MGIKSAETVWKQGEKAWNGSRKRQNCHSATHNSEAENNNMCWNVEFSLKNNNSMKYTIYIKYIQTIKKLRRYQSILYEKRIWDSYKKIY